MDNHSFSFKINDYGHLMFTSTTRTCISVENCCDRFASFFGLWVYCNAVQLVRICIFVPVVCQQEGREVEEFNRVVMQS